MNLKTPILIVGGGTGGFAAAWAIARLGGSCVVTEPTDWLGGQLTTQAVPPDENRWIEGIDGVSSATGSYLHFRREVRRLFLQHPQLTEAARNTININPGGCWVSRLGFAPVLGHQVLQSLLAEHVASGRVKVLYEHEPVAAVMQGDRVQAVVFRDLRNGAEVEIAAEYVLDATELGDVLPLAGAEYAIGAEHRSMYGELHGRTDREERLDQQAITWCLAMEHRPGENHVIDKPAEYEFWRNYVPMLDGGWPGRLFDWRVPDHKGGQRDLQMQPWPTEPDNDELELWRYRRVVDRSLFKSDARDGTDVCLVNWVQNDYFQKPVLDVSKSDYELAMREARAQSLCWFYWMQTQAPHHDDPQQQGYPGLKLRGNELGTRDGFAKAAYIREARRLIARTIITEGHVGLEQRQAEGKKPLGEPPWVAGECFADSVGIGHYSIDFHPSCALRSGLYVPACPFRIPMGALIPVRVKNLLAAGKCLGVTHVTNGCYRLHPVEWNVGEAAGVLAHFCVTKKMKPEQVHEQNECLSEYQKLLRSEGVTLTWPWE